MAVAPPAMTDIAIVGGGVIGLWVARRALQSGLRAAVIDRRCPFPRASDTPLAALLPHLPERFDPVKAFQFAALAELSGEVAALEAETGANTGYRRCGRVMPIRKQSFHDRILAAVAGARTHWQHAGGPFTLTQTPELADADLSGWLSPDVAPLGVAQDTLSAAINPRAYVAALRSFVRNHPRGRVIDGVFAHWDEKTGRASDAKGLTLATADALVLAGGHATFDWLRETEALDLGTGVKGHAMRLTFHTPTDAPDLATRPILYDNGIYVVPDGPADVVVGATTEFEWSNPRPEHPRAEAMLQAARALCPPLIKAEPVETWAGIRPRTASRKPVIGAIDPDRRLYITGGAYKISFGIAHRLAQAFVNDLTGAPAAIDVPDVFQSRHLLARSKPRNDPPD